PFGEQLTGFNLNFTYPFSGIYLLYFVSGYYLLKYIKITPRLSAAAAVVTAGFLIVDMGFLKIFRVSYDSPIIVLLSACLFLTAYCRADRVSSMTAHLNLCLSRYLFHTVFLDFFYMFLDTTHLDLAYGGSPHFWTGTNCCSSMVTWITRKISPLKKYVL